MYNFRPYATNVLSPGICDAVILGYSTYSLEFRARYTVCAFQNAEQPKKSGHSFTGKNLDPVLSLSQINDQQYQRVNVKNKHNIQT